MGINSAFKGLSSTAFCKRRPVLKNSTFNVEMQDNCVISAVMMKIKVLCDVTLCRRDIVLYVSNGHIVLCRRGYGSLCFEGSYCLVS
jgi:hypothetical protein